MNKPAFSFRISSHLFRSAWCSVAAAMLAVSEASAAAVPDWDALLRGIKAPPGFRVTLFAGPPDVAYPTCLAAAPTGELFVGIDENGSLDAKAERGRVVRCADLDGDGKADRFTTFAKLDSPRGLWFDAGTLYVMHPPFLSAYHDDNGDGVADRSEELVKGLGFDLKFRGADHTVNGMRMGIDGWLYIAVGDYGAIKAVGRDGAELQLHGGGIVRVRPDGTGLELVADGLRNIYDVAVDPLLNLFTRDNTNDGGGWNVRLSHIIHGGHYGYPSLFRNFADEIVSPLADYGGGSPCGSLFMNEPGLPDDFGAGLYTCDWGRNIVYRHPLEARGAGFKAEQNVFIEIPRPTDMDVDGASRLYISSWNAGSYTYSGPNVGFVIRVAPEAAQVNAFPDLKRLNERELVESLKMPSAVRRLHAQREILRRGSALSIAKALEEAAAGADHPYAQVAIIFTLKQLLKANAEEALLRLARHDRLREHALRALADNRAEAPSISAKPFVDALSDSNPRVRLQGAIALGRLGKAEAAPVILPLVADSDLLISHAAINALVALRASRVCLQALDTSSSAALMTGCVRVLQALHEPEVADALIERLAGAQNSATRQAALKALCRLYQREADWDGKWWGTRPDTSGPYFKPVKWERSDKILAALRQALAEADGATLPWLAIELQKNKVDLPELIPLILKVASDDVSFRRVAVDLMAGAAAIPDEAIGLLQRVALSAGEPVALRATALRALHRSAGRMETLERVVKPWIELSATGKLEDELVRVWDEFTRDGRHARNVAYFLQLAQASSGAERVLGFSVLINIANQRFGSRDAKAEAVRALDLAWKTPEATVSLLEAIRRARSNQYAHQIRAQLNSNEPAVRDAARQTAQELGIDQRAEPSASSELVEALPFEKLVAETLARNGSARVGEQLFLRQGCNACHTVSAAEPPKGPFLGGIASRYSRAELCESILKPSAKIAQGFETQWFALQSGDELEGFVVREAGEEIEMRNIQGISTIIAKSKIASRGRRETSIMPQGMVDKLSIEELAALLAYLESLRAQ